MGFVGLSFGASERIFYFRGKPDAGCCGDTPGEELRCLKRGIVLGLDPVLRLRTIPGPLHACV